MFSDDVIMILVVRYKISSFRLISIFYFFIFRITLQSTHTFTHSSTECGKHEWITFPVLHKSILIIVSFICMPRRLTLKNSQRDQTPIYKVHIDMQKITMASSFTGGSPPGWEVNKYGWKRELGRTARLLVTYQTEGFTGL